MGISSSIYPNSQFCFYVSQFQENFGKFDPLYCGLVQHKRHKETDQFGALVRQQVLANENF